MPPETYIRCNLEVVKFYSWWEAESRVRNLTIQGWDGGNSYYCEDDKHHQIKSFKEYHDYHDIEPVPGGPFDTSGIFNEVSIHGISVVSTNINFESIHTEVN